MHHLYANHSQTHSQYDVSVSMASAQGGQNVFSGRNMAYREAPKVLGPTLAVMRNSPSDRVTIASWPAAPRRAASPTAAGVDAADQRVARPP